MHSTDGLLVSQRTLQSQLIYSECHADQYIDKSLTAAAITDYVQMRHTPKIWRTKHHKKIDDRMSGINTDNIDATLSKAQPQNVMVQSKYSAVETVVGQFTGIKFTRTHQHQSKCHNTMACIIILIYRVPQNKIISHFTNSCRYSHAALQNFENRVLASENRVLATLSMNLMPPELS